MKGRRCTIPIYRTQKDRDFTVLSNYHLRDRRLSLKAKGLLSQMLSLPKDWQFSVEGLAAINKEGKDAILSALRELERAGYLRRTRVTDASGRLVRNIYTVWEIPGIQTTENQTTEIPAERNKDKNNHKNHDWRNMEWI